MNKYLRRLLWIIIPVICGITVIYLAINDARRDEARQRAKADLFKKDFISFASQNKTTTVIFPDKGDLVAYNIVTGKRSLFYSNSKFCSDPAVNPAQSLCAFFSYSNSPNKCSTLLLDLKTRKVVADIPLPSYYPYIPNAPAWSADGKKIGIVAAHIDDSDKFPPAPTEYLILIIDVPTWKINKKLQLQLPQDDPNRIRFFRGIKKDTLLISLGRDFWQTAEVNLHDPPTLTTFSGLVDAIASDGTILVHTRQGCELRKNLNDKGVAIGLPTMAMFPQFIAGTKYIFFYADTSEFLHPIICHLYVYDTLSQRHAELIRFGPQPPPSGLAISR
jgi:hypothetical protein